MNKHFLKGIVLGTVCTMVLSICVPAIASTGKKNIEVAYNNIKIFIYGEEKKPAQEPFVLNGTTFVPLRFVSESLGETVNWDGKTNSIYIGETPKGNSTPTVGNKDNYTQSDAEEIVKKVMEIQNEKVTYIGFEDFGGEAVYYDFQITAPISGGAGVSFHVYVSIDTGLVYDENLDQIK